MKQSDHKTNETYLAKWLAGEITDKEIQTYISEKDFLAYTKIKEGLEYFVAPEFDVNKTKKNITSKIQQKPKKVFQLNWYAAAAAVILLLTSAYFFNASLPTHIQTNFGEQKTFVLNDGSEAVLNAKSYIQYPKKWNDKRELDLHGEAFFKVKKGKSFTVNTNNGAVTVLGTQFDVNSQPDFFLVKCYEGKVRVIQNRDTIYLSKGKAYQNYNLNIDLWDFTSDQPNWVKGESDFKSVPLEVVLNELENQYEIKIKSDKIDTSQLFTGSFGHKNLNIALKSVFYPMGINFKIENKKVFLSKK
ncbi:MAG: hypothetical protein DRJ07_16990 [Bacteroidetes bacterium]|nr:MAG: hypothetical protein DRJ07_16990 [Bacteroidota bacterium]